MRWASLRTALHEAHVRDVVALGVREFDLLQQLGVDRMALVFQNVERKGDIGRGDLRSVEEPRLGPQAKAIVELVARNAHRLSQQPIYQSGSSPLAVISVSNVAPIPAAPLPFQL